MSKTNWEQLLIDRITERLEISSSRAFSIIQTHYSEMLIEWKKGSTPNQAASVLINL